MRRDLEEKLFKEYPDILKGYGGDPKDSCLAFGFEHGDGWYKLIDALLGLIQWHMENYNRNKKQEEQMEVVADQIKEKFSTLRFYYHGGDDFIDGLVSFAEAFSGEICENCGTTIDVHRNKTGYLLTLCSDCRLQKDNREST